MSNAQDLSLFLAFLAGLISFLSPCVLPLLPSYLAFITGLSFEELIRQNSSRQMRQIIFTHSLLFIMGFSILFTLMGASATLLGQFLASYRDMIRLGGGMLIIFFGFFISGIIPLDFLQREKKWHWHQKPLGYLGTFFIGVTFAAGWTPCVGPILSAILLYASTAENIITGIKLLLIYSLGMAIPFLISALALSSFLKAFQKARRFIGIFTKVGGILLICIGILLLTNSFDLLNEFLSRWFPDFSF
ncbi:MAG: cytochrome c biogenesis CcdA family protein [Thermodesulfobacteriota bacterium]